MDVSRADGGATLVDYPSVSESQLVKAARRMITKLATGAATMDTGGVCRRSLCRGGMNEAIFLLIRSI